jgi:hypothetical protein
MVDHWAMVLPVASSSNRRGSASAQQRPMRALRLARHGCVRCYDAESFSETRAPRAPFSTFVLCMGKSRQHRSLKSGVTRRLIPYALGITELAMARCCPASWHTTAENGLDGAKTPEFMRRSEWANPIGANPHDPNTPDALLRSLALASAVHLRSESPRAPPNVLVQRPRRQCFRRNSQGHRF